MSPSWRDRVRIALRPDRVAIVRLPKGLHEHVGEKNLLSCAAEASGTSAPNWQAAVDVLGDAARKWNGGRADATVVLSNHFVRYVLVPWSDALSSEQELRDFARHCFAQIYGDAAAGWEVRVSSGGAGATAVASAVEPGLLQALAQAFHDSPLRLRSVQPYLMAAYNRWRQHFSDTTAWFALAEHGRLCLAQFHRNQWHSLRGLAVGDQLDAELPTILERERYLSNLDPADPSVFLFGTEQASRPITGFRFLDLPACPGFSPAEDRDYAMAMSG